MNHLSFARTFGAAIICCAIVLVGGCATLIPQAAPHPSFYALERASASADEPADPARAPAPPPSTAPTLMVNPPHAAAGFDSTRIIYTRTPHEIEYFAYSQWVDTPAHMLAPLIVAAIQAGGARHAVILAPSAATGDIRLDTEILRLQQEFGSGPSRVRFTLHAYIVDSVTRRVLAWREFDETVSAPSEDPYGGVVAANQAVQRVLKALASLCAEATANWKPPA